MALYAIPVHIAIAYKIPPIFLGESCTYYWRTAWEAGRRCLSNEKCKYLQGGSPRHLMNKEMTEQDVHFYNYPSERDVIKASLN